MESFMNLVASIHSHAERVSSAYYEARRSGLTMNGMTHSIARRYEFLFLGLSILAIAALINSGIGALRAISAFFFARLCRLSSHRGHLGARSFILRRCLRILCLACAMVGCAVVRKHALA
jgi:hypothetical protein